MVVKHLRSDEQFAPELSNAGEKLVVVDFFAAWCGPCRIVAPHFEALSTQYTNVVFLKVNVEEMTETTAIYGVRAMPTFLFFKQGQKVAEVQGARLDEIESNIKLHSLSLSAGQSVGDVDPFTGAGRYVPGGCSSNSARTTGGVDPFTGSSSYTSGSSNAAKSANAEPAKVLSTTSPAKEFVGFHLGNVEGALKKLTEASVPDKIIQTFSGLMQKEIPSSLEVSQRALDSIRSVLKLPEEKLFPALDLLRLAIRHPRVCKFFCTEVDDGKFFAEKLLSSISSSSASPGTTTNKQLSLKVLSNIFVAGQIGQDFMFRHRRTVLEAVLSTATTSIVDKTAPGTNLSGETKAVPAPIAGKQVPLARATLLLNYAVLYGLKNSEIDLEDLINLVHIVIETAKNGDDAPMEDETVFRLMVALGTVLKADENGIVKDYAVTLDCAEILTKITDKSGDERVKSTWNSLRTDLKI
ncbi:hypothetical protein RvY_03960 [Ramazzottius varieornatus]|uniref:Thioredoxin domain-containing protein n=1 Tax=Ramazzottius varieornatus TaxID=947166 RepID=A0A1D1UPX6_RAMVA|nr:hypothetical protein RvY_03960 [Ramazzottius varieornatus]